MRGVSIAMLSVAVPWAHAKVPLPRATATVDELLATLVERAFDRSSASTASFREAGAGFDGTTSGKHIDQVIPDASSSRSFSALPPASVDEAQTGGGAAKFDTNRYAGKALSNVSVSMDILISICKQRGFVYPSSEIYGGINGFYDYGPLGIELKNNIKKLWWRDMVHRREDVVGLDTSIIASTKIWQNSGHLERFVDPMVLCNVSKQQYRADHLFFSEVIAEEDGKLLGYVSVQESGDMEKEASAMASKVAKEAGLKGAKLRELRLRDLTEASEEEIPLIPSPATGKPGSLQPPKDFQMMFATKVGAVQDASATAYLRPETAQGIFINFKNVETGMRKKLPFGIAQIGKAFRNEISTSNYVFRSREFEQMEIEYFISPSDEDFEKYYAEWVEVAWSWLKSIGLREELLGRDVHPQHKLAHYARACTDITFKFPFGQQELQGIAARGSFDLTQHQNGSGKPLDYLPDGSKEKYVPHCIEPSIGVDRLFLALICSAYSEDTVDGEKRNFMRFHPLIAPYQVAVFPLMKKDGLAEKAKDVYHQLMLRYHVFYDTAGAIGRRYRRMDEVGTPYCITIDYQTLNDTTVTVRDRDSCEQDRMRIDELLPYLSKKIEGV